MGIIYDFFGGILNLIFEGVAMLTDVGALGITIIMFTLVAQLLLTPIKMKQQRSMRAMNRMQPELQKLQKKYGDKKDQASQAAYSQEMQALYKKHNANPLSGCLPLIIQLPLIYALYGVLRQPARYINRLGEVYENIATTLQSQVDNFQQVIEKIITDIPSPAIQQAMASAKEPLATSDILSHFTTQQWNALQEVVTPEAFNSVSGLLTEKTNFELFIVNLVDTPQQLFTTLGIAALLIPVIAGLSTFIFSKVTMAASKASQPAPNPDAPNPADGMMKAMNIMMPLMMGFISWTVPTGLALYWVAGNIIMMFQQMIVTRVVDKKEAIVDAQIEAQRQAELAASQPKKKKKKKKKKVVVEGQTPDTTQEHTAEEEPKKSDTQKED